VRSSGVYVLDEEALALIRRAEPFPPPPQELAGCSVEGAANISANENEIYKVSTVQRTGSPALGAKAMAAKQVKSLSDGLLGEWCLEVETSTEKTHVYKRGFCRNSDRWITVTSVRQIGHEFGCNISRIKEIVRDKTFRVDMKCGGEGMEWTDSTTFNLSDDYSTLYLRERKRTSPKEVR
jgi:hypothetical protein